MGGQGRNSSGVPQFSRAAELAADPPLAEDGAPEGAPEETLDELFRGCALAS